MSNKSNENVNKTFTEVLTKDAKVELVRNPYIALYLHEKNKKESFILSEKLFVPINHDELYNENVSSANLFYLYSDHIKESSNIRYVRVSSGIVPESYVQALADTGYDTDDDWLIPYDYLLVTRTDGTQFLIAENFIEGPIAKTMHKYSIIRYVNKRELFREDCLYSDGIDLSRLLNNDQEYINKFSNEFLSERRLNESLMTVYSALDIQKSDETNHGGQYLGYIDASDLCIYTSMEKNELLLFEKNLREGRMAS